MLGPQLNKKSRTDNPGTNSNLYVKTCEYGFRLHVLGTLGENKLRKSVYEADKFSSWPGRKNRTEVLKSSKISMYESSSKSINRS